MYTHVMQKHSNAHKKKILSARVNGKRTGASNEQGEEEKKGGF